MDASRGEGFEVFWADAGIRHEDVDGRGRADQRGTEVSYLGGVGDHDDLSRIADHRLRDGGLFRLKGGYAALEIETRGADECLVHVDILQKPERGLPGEGKRPGPCERPSGKGGLDGGLVAQLHADVEGVRDDGDPTAMAKGPPNLGSSGPSGEADGLLIEDELGSGETDPAFFIRPAVLACLEGGVVTEWLI